MAALGAQIYRKSQAVQRYLAFLCVGLGWFTFDRDKGRRVLLRAQSGHSEHPEKMGVPGLIGGGGSTPPALSAGPPPIKGTHALARHISG